MVVFTFSGTKTDSNMHNLMVIFIFFVGFFACLFICFFFSKLQLYKNKQQYKQNKIYNNITILKFHWEEVKQKEELAEDHGSLIIKSLVCLSKTISSFLSRIFLSYSGVEGFIHASNLYNVVFQQPNVVFLVPLKTAGFSIRASVRFFTFFFFIQDVILQFQCTYCCSVLALSLLKGRYDIIISGEIDRVMKALKIYTQKNLENSESNLSKTQQTL